MIDCHVASTLLAMTTQRLMKLDIRKTDDPILRQPTEEVIDFDLELQMLIDNMIETMRVNNGVGLAAPQIGVSQKIFICEFTGDKEAKLPEFPLTVMINPKITHYSKEQRRMVEGCLSFPGLEILIKRPSKITIEGQDRYGKKISIDADGIYARVMQHENDHLNSTLLIDHIREINTVFIGTGSLGLPTLEALAIDPQYKIKLVVTSDFTATSRKVKNNLIEELAKKYKLPILKTKNINSPEMIEKIRKTKPEVAIMADFGQIVKKELLNLPKYGIINIHPSLLPRHRGPSPIQQTILDGDQKTGVTLIVANEKMDAGKIVSVVSFKLTGSETSTILKDYAARAGASLILNSLPYYLAGDLKPFAQKDAKATFSHFFKYEDGFVGSTTPAVEVERKIRAFDDWPKVHTLIKEKQIQILSAHFDAEGKLIIDRVKPAGKAEMTYEDFQRGYHTELTFQP